MEDPENPTEEEQQQLADYEAQMLIFTEENDAYNGQMNAYLAALEEYNREKEEYEGYTMEKFFEIKIMHLNSLVI